MAFYELMFIVRPELDEEQVSAATDKVHQLIVANGGSVTKTASWGKRRLAYQVGPHREGYYVVSNFEIETPKITELERVLKISDTVFRHLLVRRERAAVGQTEVVIPDFTDEDIAAMSRVSDEDYDSAPPAVGAAEDEAPAEEAEEPVEAGAAPAASATAGGDATGEEGSE